MQMYAFYIPRGFTHHFLDSLSGSEYRIYKNIMEYALKEEHILHGADRKEIEKAEEQARIEAMYERERLKQINNT